MKKIQQTTLGADKIRSSMNYGMNVYLLPKSICWSLEHCDSTWRWYLPVELDLEEVLQKDGISALRRHQSFTLSLSHSLSVSFSPSPPCKATDSRQYYTRQERALTRYLIGQYLDLGLSSFHNCGRNKCLLFKAFR
jgi:hypothetical protein